MKVFLLEIIELDILTVWLKISFGMNIISVCAASVDVLCVSVAFLNEMIAFCSRWQIRGEEHGGVQAECSSAASAAAAGGDRNCAHRPSPRGAARDGVAAPRLLCYRELDCSDCADRQHRISTMCRQKYWRRSGEFVAPKWAVLDFFH